jgi:phage gp16-like protein
MSKTVPTGNTKGFAQRNKLIALIHVGKKELGLDDPSYRQLLLSYGGKDSSRLLNHTQLQSVLKRMRDLGFATHEPEKKPIQRYAPTGSQSSAEHLLYNLWEKLHVSGKVTQNTEAALCAWLKRQTGIERVEWLSSQKLSKCIEAAKQWLNREPEVTTDDPDQRS